MPRKSAPKTGTRDEVWDGVATQTSGGLKRKDLRLNANGAIVSRKKSDMARLLAPNL
jgi:hypothetical protein